MSGKSITMMIISIFILIVVFILLLGYYFDWFKLFNTNSYTKYTPPAVSNRINNISSLNTDRSNDININTMNKLLTTTTVVNTDKLVQNVNPIPINTSTTIINDKFVKHSSGKSKKTSVEKNNNPVQIVNTKDEVDAGYNFHTFGEYISDSEYNYRVSIIKSLMIKTIIIDYISNGNGVKEEFYKIVFKANMIPAKVLDKVIESKEFRDLIPAEYREKVKIDEKDKVVFKNTDIKNLLLLWTMGRLTPIEKAVKSKAVK